MKKYLLAFCCFAGMSVMAQAPKWDSTARPGNFQLKWDQFKSFKDSKKDIVFLGNSITAGVDWTELLDNPRIKNRGISGDITYGILERLDEVIEGQPAKVFILIGINDISKNIPDSCVIQNHRKMADRIKAGSPRTKIYFQTIFPVNNTFTQFKSHYNKDEHIAAINDGIRKLAAVKGVTVIDTHAAFLDADGRLKKECTYDGLHLKIEGYRIWADLLKKGNYLK